MAHLRRVIAQIEAEAGPAGERGTRRLSLTRALDSALGGGLADDALHEIVPAGPACRDDRIRGPHDDYHRAPG